MKHLKLFAIIYILIICTSSCRDTPEEKPEDPVTQYRLIKLHYENFSGEQGITHFYYDLEERNYLAIWQLADSSRSSLNSYSYDSAGNMVVKSREFSHGLKSIQHFEYDSIGNLLWEDFNRSDSVTGIVNYHYGLDGRLQSADCR